MAERFPEKEPFRWQRIWLSQIAVDDLGIFPFSRISSNNADQQRVKINREY